METVKYIGTASTRIIREKEWDVAGVTKQDTIVWNAENGWTVDAAKLSQDAKDAIRRDPFFVFSGEADKVEQEETIDLDLAAEAELLANKNSADNSPEPTSAAVADDGSAAKSQRKP